MYFIFKDCIVKQEIFTWVKCGLILCCANYRKSLPAKVNLFLHQIYKIYNTRKITVLNVQGPGARLQFRNCFPIKIFLTLYSV